MSKLFFFRHAQASLGKENYDVLSKKGELQAAELGKFLTNNNMKFDKIYVGELRRQQHTYEIVKEIFEKKRLHIPSPTILKELNEHQATEAMKIHLPNMINSDPYINKLWKEIEKEPSKKNGNLMLGFEYFLNKWIDNKIIVKRVVPWTDFRKNVNRGLKKILINTKKSEKIGVFTSGGTISSITGYCLKIKDEKRIASLNFSIRNTSFSTFLYSKKQFNLLSFNELPHLKKDMVTFV
ncbi:MAG: histidine phosphatase family protein [Flavobacteriaceae bacterium]